MLSTAYNTIPDQPSPLGAELPFHPLADLFPLIEGEEFDELVASIKEDGQLEPIITLDGAIIDGRNRYRACRVIGVEPRAEIFTGENPARFVAAKNVHRRHLTEAQRALIAAGMARLLNGSNQFSRSCETEGVATATPIVTGTEAAELMGVHRTSVQHAKLVLHEGTPEEIEAVKNGSIGVKTVANQIRSRIPEDQRKQMRETGISIVGKNPQRLQTQAVQAELWRKFRQALEHLTELPLPTEIVSIARNYDKRNNGKVVAKRLSSALQWLTEFRDAWEVEQ